MAEFELEGGIYVSVEKFNVNSKTFMSELLCQKINQSISYISMESNKFTTEYGDAGGAPPEVEVEDNRPLQERIGDKVRDKYDLRIIVGD